MNPVDRHEMVIQSYDDRATPNMFASPEPKAEAEAKRKQFAMTNLNTAMWSSISDANRSFMMGTEDSIGE